MSLCFFQLSATASFADGPLAPVEKSFPNGMRVLYAPRPAAGAVLVAVSVAAGGQDEPADRAGQSHFLEHLLFDGFDTLDERAITEAFARRAAYVNAFTRDQSTVFFVLAPRADATAAAEMVAAMVSRSTIPEASFEKERKVILEELAKDASNPASKDEQALQRLLWADTPWALGSGGTPDTVGRATRDEVVSYWKTFYRPDRMRLLIAGDASMPQLDAIAAPFRALVRAKGEVPARRICAAGAGGERGARGPCRRIKHR
ncbi:MAG: insulinase family protein [Acidobacteriota bacterium]